MVAFVLFLLVFLITAYVHRTIISLYLYHYVRRLLRVLKFRTKV